MVSTRWTAHDSNADQFAVNNASNGKTMVLNYSRMPMMLANERVCFGKR
jgi:hypothetical protein